MQCLHTNDWIRRYLSIAFLTHYTLELVPSQRFESFLLDDRCTVFHCLELSVPLTSLLRTDT